MSTEKDSHRRGSVTFPGGSGDAECSAQDSEYCGCCSFLTAAASGQELATLNVSVTDPFGGAIPKAQIAIQSVETRATRNDATNGAGLVSVPGLPAGSYKLLVSAPEFGK